MDDNNNRTIQTQGSQYFMHICITHKWHAQVNWEFCVDNEKVWFWLIIFVSCKKWLAKTFETL